MASAQDLSAALAWNDARKVMSRARARALGCMACPLASGKCVSDIDLQFLDRGSRRLACIAGLIILAFAEEVVGGLLFKVLSKHLNH